MGENCRKKGRIERGRAVVLIKDAAFRGETPHSGVIRRDRTAVWRVELILSSSLTSLSRPITLIADKNYGQRFLISGADCATSSLLSTSARNKRDGMKHGVSNIKYRL